MLQLRKSVADMDTVEHMPSANSNMYLGPQRWKDLALADQGNIKNGPGRSIAWYGLVLHAYATISGLQRKGSVANGELGALKVTVKLYSQVWESEMLAPRNPRGLGSAGGFGFRVYLV